MDENLAIYSKWYEKYQFRDTAIQKSVELKYYPGKGKSDNTST